MICPSGIASHSGGMHASQFEQSFQLHQHTRALSPHNARAANDNQQQMSEMEFNAERWRPSNADGDVRGPGAPASPEAARMVTPRAPSLANSVLTRLTYSADEVQCEPEEGKPMSVRVQHARAHANVCMQVSSVSKAQGGTPPPHTHTHAHTHTYAHTQTNKKQLQHPCPCC